MKHDNDAGRILNRLARRGKIDFATLDERAGQLRADGQSSLAAALYHGWIQRYPQHPQLAVAWFMLGDILSGNGKHDAARDAFIAARDIYLRIPQPTYEQFYALLGFHFYLGEEYRHLRENQKAIEQWRWVIKHANIKDPKTRQFLLDSLNHAGSVYGENQQYPDALQCRTLSLNIEPKQPKAFADLISMRQGICQWPVDAPLGEASYGMDDWMREQNTVFMALDFSDDPEYQLTIARNEAASKVPLSAYPISSLQEPGQERAVVRLPDLPPHGFHGHEKLRIGYASSDFHGHPVGRLVVELLELHDRERFEVYAFDWSKAPDDSAHRQRIITACGDRFIRIHDLDDIDAAQLIRDQEIDVLFDLQGLTAGCRPLIFAHRPAR
jgi:predicted O-linked N-acetylglucosamine transferase (SPINDLY family)